MAGWGRLVRVLFLSAAVNNAGIKNSTRMARWGRLVRVLFLSAAVNDVGVKNNTRIVWGADALSQCGSK